MHVAAPAVLLLMGIAPLWHDELKVILGAGHPDVEQTAFFLDFLSGAGGKSKGDAAIDTIEHKNGSPLLALRRMNS
jgi:hypothetical protein